MKAVLMSIQPKWCELIANGKKTIEVRKTKPKLETPFKVYIYCTKGETIYLPRDIFGNNALNGKVIGELICDEITVAECGSFCVLPKSKTMLDELDLLEYADEKTVYGWHISDLVIYDEPKELSEFWKADKCPYALKNGCTYKYHCFRSGQVKRCGETLTRPPQSWCYVEGVGDYCVP